MGVRAEIKGQAFGRLIALRPSRVAKNRKVVWECRCACGATSYVTATDLRMGNTKSCGCLRVDVTTARLTSHGQAAGKQTRTYRAWAEMRKRCLSKTSTLYYAYGAKGVTICKEWSSFEKFYFDMGACPPAYELDRINNKKGYSKSNCRWATDVTQGRNRACVKLTIEKARAIRADTSRPRFIAKEYGITVSTVWSVKVGKTWKENAV